jgi:hypothetical protein
MRTYIVNCEYFGILWRGWGGGVASYTPRPPNCRSRNNLCKDDSALFSMGGSIFPPSTRILPATMKAPIEGFACVYSSLRKDLSSWHWYTVAICNMIEMMVCALADSMASSDSYSPSLRFSRFRSPTMTEHRVTHTAARISVADPWHFGMDPDPDPRIHASD